MRQRLKLLGISYFWGKKFALGSFENVSDGGTMNTQNILLLHCAFAYIVELIRIFQALVKLIKYLAKLLSKFLC